MSASRVVGYQAGSTILHRMDPRAKAVASAVLILVAFLFNNPPILFCILLIPLACLLELRAWRNRSVRGLVGAVLVVAVAALLLNSFVNPAGRTVFFYTIPDSFAWAIKWEGFYIGLAFCIRVLIMGLTILVFLLTTKPSYFATALMHWHFPRTGAFLFLAMMQLVPIIERKIEFVQESQLSRGMKTKTVPQKLKAIFALAIPMILLTFEQTDMLAISLESRAFGAPGKKSSLVEIRLRTSDYLIFAFSAIALTVSLVIRAFEGDFTVFHGIV